MGGHHHHLIRFEVQEFHAGQIGLGVGLVGMGQLSAQYAVPGQSGVLGHIGHQRDVAVGHGGQDELGLQPVQSRGCVRPGVQPVPGQVQVGFGLFADTGDAEVIQQLFKAHPVQAVQFGPGQFPGAHLVHEGTVLGPPAFGKGHPVGGYAVGLAEVFAVAGDRTVPVHHGAEHVEHQSLDLR